MNIKIRTYKYTYTFSNDEDFSSNPDYNKLYLFEDAKTSICHPDVDILTADSYSPLKEDDDGKAPFSFAKIDATYLSKHAFTRVSLYKYISEDLAVIDDFLDMCCPYLRNEGYYMTYKKVSIELDNYDSITRVRIYASPTQSGKLIDTYLKEEYPNWYLMFSESIVKDIGKTVIPALGK